MLWLTEREQGHLIKTERFAVMLCRLFEVWKCRYRTDAGRRLRETEREIERENFKENVLVRTRKQPLLKGNDPQGVRYTMCKPFFSEED